MKMVIALLFLTFLANSVEAQQKPNVNEESNLPQDRSKQMTLYQTATKTPGLMSYLGLLADASGKPITAATNVTFAIYDSVSGGSPLWSETHNITPASNGAFGLTLGSITPISATLFKDNATLYLGVKVGSDIEMSPRQRITSAAFAFSAETASPREGYGNPVAVGSANSAGTAITLARSDHMHQGLRSINGLFGDVTLRGSGVYVTTSGQSIEIGLPDKVRSIGVSGSPALFGDVTLAAGMNITLSQSGAAITITGSAADGSASFTNLAATGNATLGDAATDMVTINGALNVTTAAGGLVNVLTGNLKVGNGSPDVALNGENAYVEGTLEVDGNVRFDGAVNISAGALADSTVTSADIADGTITGSDISSSTTLTIGNLAIGATSVTYGRLYVAGTGAARTGNWAFYKINDAGNNIETGTASSGPVASIYATDRIVTGTEFNAFSDARIKNIQGVSDSAKDLNTLRQIEIVDFTYKDPRKRDGLEKKAIGQQLAKVYSQAVSFMTEVVADIMRNGIVSGNVITLPNHGLKTGDRVKLIFEEGDIEKVYSVLAVTSDTFTVDENKQGGVFVYGREVDDFHIVDYEAIAMLNVSATQELAVRLEAQQKIIAAQQKQIESLQAEIKAIRESLTSAPRITTVVSE